MNSKEAILLLNEIKYRSEFDDDREALENGVEALEKQKKTVDVIDEFLKRALKEYFHFSLDIDCRVVAVDDLKKIADDLKKEVAND